MIEIKVTTKLIFESEQDFKKYLKTDTQALITGFASELEQAWALKTPMTVETPRPEIGAVTESYIEVLEHE